MNTFCLVAAVTLAVANAGLLAPVPHAGYGILAHNLVAPVAAKVVVPAGHGAEGQYIPDNLDNLDKLYDDGSYKPELRTVPLAPSPYGLVEAGSGLEGQYVPDINEKLSDDGSYKPELQRISLSPSPYGLVPSGSGLEGQYVPELQTVKLSPTAYGLTPAGSGLEGAYVPDLTEKLYDDGSYKPGVYAASAVHVAPAVYAAPAKVFASGVKVW